MSQNENKKAVLYKKKILFFVSDKLLSKFAAALTGRACRAEKLKYHAASALGI